MNGSIQKGQQLWKKLDLDPEERTIIRKEITDNTSIVRYVLLSTLFLYLSNHAFIPSLRLLKDLDPLDGELLYQVNVPEFQENLKLYGSRGVAIHSTVGDVKKSLENSGPLRCLVVPVRYPIGLPARLFEDAKI
jgi:hypothetical protein